MTEKAGNLTSADFTRELYRRFDEAQSGRIVVSAGELHKTLRAANRLSLASNAMYDVQNIGDVIHFVPSGGAGSTLELSYAIPREKGLNLEKSIYTGQEVASSYEQVMKKFEVYAAKHPVLRGLADIVRQKKSERAARSLVNICMDVCILICKMQHVRLDNQKFGTICGAVGRAGLLSDEGLYALDFVRIIGNSNARRVPDEFLLTPKVFSYEAYAASIFLDEAIEKGLLWKKETGTDR